MTVYQGFGDTNIGQQIIGDLYSKNVILRSEFQCTITQINYKFYQTKSFIVLCCLHLFNFCTNIFTLLISPRSCRDSISFAYSCFIPESLIYRAKQNRNKQAHTLLDPISHKTLY